MNCSKVFASLACACLAFGLVGCGATNHLQSITLNVTKINGVPPSSQTGFVTLQGNGGTIQLQAMGNYSNTKSVDISAKVTYNVIVDPDHNQDAFDNTLPVPPCKAGSCPTSAPFTTGTVEYSPTGMITAVEPATCSFVDIAPVVTVGTDPTPAWFYVGDYMVTATYAGVTSQPIYIPVASSAGDQYYPHSQENNPNYENNSKGRCGS